MSEHEEYDLNLSDLEAMNIDDPIKIYLKEVFCII